MEYIKFQTDKSITYIALKDVSYLHQDIKSKKWHFDAHGRTFTTGGGVGLVFVSLDQLKADSMEKATHNKWRNDTVRAFYNRTGGRETTSGRVHSALYVFGFDRSLGELADYINKTKCAKWKNFANRSYNELTSEFYIYVVEKFGVEIRLHKFDKPQDLNYLKTKIKKAS